MFFVCNLIPTSQAECRRFDPGLPLQEISKIEESRSMCAPSRSTGASSVFHLAPPALPLCSDHITGKDFSNLLTACGRLATGDVESTRDSHREGGRPDSKCLVRKRRWMVSLSTGQFGEAPELLRHNLSRTLTDIAT